MKPMFFHFSAAGRMRLDAMSGRSIASRAMARSPRRSLRPVELNRTNSSVAFR